MTELPAPETVELGSWEELKLRVQELRAAVVGSTRRWSPVLFRGHADARWSLETTLERRVSRPFAFSEYYRTISVVRPEIESLTGHRWAIPDLTTVERQFAEYDTGKLVLNGMPGYEYIAYLRHYGFPSPLLDWTRSPYVAAHFAFAPRPSAEKASIYAFCERPQNMKGGSSSEPQIVGLGPIVGTHKRHFLQQCEYTVCVKYDHRWRFEPHSAVFDLRHPNQDLLWKFNLPIAERRKVLSELALYNLNGYSLFGSEESLMDTLSARELEEID